MTSNKKVLAFVEESKNLCQPNQIVWIDGSRGAAGRPARGGLSPPAK